MEVKKNSDKISGVRHRTHESVDMIMDKAGSMRDYGKEKMVHLKEKSVEMKENVEGYIRKNPKKSVLIAAGIGAVIGAMVAAAMMRRKD